METTFPLLANHLNGVKNDSDQSLSWYSVDLLIDWRCRRSCSSRWVMSLQSTATSTTTVSTVANLQAVAVSFLPTSSDLLTPRRVPDTLAVPRTRWRQRRCPRRRRWPVVRGRGSPKLRTASRRLPRPYRPRFRPSRDGLVMFRSRRLCPARRHPHNRRRRQTHATSLWRYRRRTSAVRNPPTTGCVAADKLSADEVAWASRLRRIGVLGDRKRPCRWTGFPRPSCWGRQTGPNNSRLGYHGQRWILQNTSGLWWRHDPPTPCLPPRDVSMWWCCRLRPVVVICDPELVPDFRVNGC